MNKYLIYVAGEFVQTKNELLVTNPFDGSVVAKTYQASADDLEKATQKAVALETEMAQLPTFKRFQILKQISESLIKNKAQLALILSQESGKPLRYALGEIDRSAQTFLIAAEEAKRIPGEELMRLDWTEKGAGKMGLVKQFPVGAVAGISPFNFPLNLAVHKIAPAIAAGCPIVLKPASSTPLSCLELAKIIDETDLPKGAVSVLPMNRTVGNALVTDNRFKLLSFTGSPVVGWKMKEQAGEKPVVLELGGNAGAILAESANVDLAINSCAIGAFAYSGQICIHTQRFFVHKNLYNKFIQSLVEKVEKMVIGNPINPETEFSAMIDEKNAQRVKQWIDEAIAEGATLVYGGKQNGTMVEPTILTNVKNNSKINTEEVFGPVVMVDSFEDFSEAIQKINDSKFGLQAGVYTEKFSEVQQAFNAIHCGGVIHNNVPTFRVDHMPYGGIKQSGLGREGVKYAMKDMLEPRVLVYEG